MESVRTAATSRSSEPDGRRVCPLGTSEGSIDLPPGNTAKTGRLSVCKSVDAVGGVLEVDEPGTLFRVPARIRGVELDAILVMDGKWCGRRDAAEREGRNDRGIVRARISLT